MRVGSRGSDRNPESRVGRVLVLLAQEGEMRQSRYVQILQTVCDSKQQRINLNADLVKRGFVERVVRVKADAR